MNESVGYPACRFSVCQGLAAAPLHLVVRQQNCLRRRRAVAARWARRLWRAGHGNTARAPNAPRVGLAEPKGERVAHAEVLALERVRNVDVKVARVLVEKSVSEGGRSSQDDAITKQWESSRAGLGERRLTLALGRHARVPVIFSPSLTGITSGR